MSRLPKGEASAAAATAAVDTAVEPFNGADPAAFDHDHDGQPGGSAPAADGPAPIEVAAEGEASSAPVERQVAAVLLAPFEGIARGIVVSGPASRVEPLVEAEAARLATERDLAVAGRNVRAI